MNLKEMKSIYLSEGLSDELASARVCQDIVLKAIAEGPLNRNVTIKGGVVLRSLTNDKRRATRDIDLDFIHYSLNEESILKFIETLNCLDGFYLSVNGKITTLKHQDYHGKSVKLKISDKEGSVIESKMDIGVHKHLDIMQEEYCFDVCMDDQGASLLRNSAAQLFAEKLRALLIFGTNSGRYKDIYDLYYLKDKADYD